jgi:hypothetical protein
VRDPRDRRADAFLYRYRFASENGETVVSFDAEVELPSAAPFSAVARPARCQERVDDNHGTLKRILERDRH